MSARAQFRVAGIPVRVEPLFWLITGLMGFDLANGWLILQWIVVVFVSILVHELGHGLALKAFGQRSSIVLHGFGGLTFSARKLDKRQSIIVSLAGPLSAGLLLGLPAWWVRKTDWYAGLGFSGGLGLVAIIEFASFVNIWWTVANLLPIRPLDGGAVATELIGIEKARILSIIAGAAAAVWAYSNPGLTSYAAFFAAFLAFINFSEYRKAKMGAAGPSTFDVEPPDPGATRTRRLSSPPTRPPVREGNVTALPGGMDVEGASALAASALRRGDGPGAKRVLARANGPVDPFLRATADVACDGTLDSLVAAYLAKPGGPSNLLPATVVSDGGQVLSLAQRLVGCGPDGLQAAGSIQTHLHYADRFEHAAAVGQILYAAGAPAKAQIAFDTACSWSKAGMADRGMQWLDRAVGDGFNALGLIDGEPDLAAVRAHPRYHELRDRL